jgi:predicted Zn-dependent protease
LQPAFKGETIENRRTNEAEADRFGVNNFCRAVLRRI